MWLTEQAEHQVRRRDFSAARSARRLLRGHHDVAGARGEAAESVGGIERRYRLLADEALLGRLLGDAHAPANLRPRRAGAAGLINEVTDEVVCHVVEVFSGDDSVGELVQRT